MSAKLISITNIAWLAGLWEGEGCFSRTDARSIRMQLSMTDEDVVRKAALLMGVKVLGPYAKPGLKPFWKMSFGSAKAAGWMMTLYSFLGERRRASVEEALRAYKTIRKYGRKSVCHPEVAHWGNGLCKRCHHRAFMRAYRAKARSFSPPQIQRRASRTSRLVL
jgi:hypothetical protein